MPRRECSADRVRVAVCFGLIGTDQIIASKDRFWVRYVRIVVLDLSVASRSDIWRAVDCG